MTLAMTRPWKHPKTGMYWLRKRVPDNLRDVLGKREEKRSLKTKSAVEAKARLADELVQLEKKWSNLRRGAATITEIEAHELAAPLYDEWIAVFRDNPSDQNRWNTEVGVETIWNPTRTGVPPHLHTYVDLFAERIQQDCLQKADHLLEKAGRSTDEKSRLRLARAVSAAIHRASITLQQMALGGSIDLAQTNGHRSTSIGRTVRLRELLDGWAREKNPGKKTLYDWTRIVGQLEKFLGHSDAARIQVADLNRWKASLLEKGLRAKTIRDGRLAPVRAILQWGVDNEKLATNPASKVVLGVKQKAGDRKRGYTDDEAKNILSAARKQKSTPLRWLPWLCAYSGARISEVSQLRATDISKIEGIWCMRITPEAGSIKTVSSERVVPLHSALLDEGFIKFASAKSEVLFPSLTPDKFGSRGGNATKILSRWIRSLGLEDKRISPNHSWRHRIKTLARRHGLASDIVDAIVGHGKRSVGDAYGEFPVTALKREIEKIPAIAF
jgi:integrase